MNASGFGRNCFSTASLRNGWDHRYVGFGCSIFLLFCASSTEIGLFFTGKYVCRTYAELFVFDGIVVSC